MIKRNKIIISMVVFAIAAGGTALKVNSVNRSRYTQVKTSAASIGDIKSYLSTTGTIKSQNSKEYYGQSGKVLKVNFKIGDKVKQGDILVTYDVSDLNAQVKSAEIAYNNAVLARQDALNQNNDVINKINDLNKQISDTSNAETIYSLKSQRDALKPASSEKLKQLDNSVASAKTNLDLSKQKLNGGSNIVSETIGTVTTLNITEGTSGIMSSQVQGAAIVVQDLDNLKVEISVGKYDANKVAIGQGATIKSNGKEYKGKVISINPAASKSVSAAGNEASLGIDVGILDKTSELKVDFDCDVDVLLSEVKNVVKIPSESLKTDKNGNNYIYIIDGEKAKEVAVKTGIESDTEIQIIEGVKNGERVILNPGNSITNGALVKETAGGK